MTPISSWAAPVPHAELGHDLAVADWRLRHGAYAEALLLEPTRKAPEEGPAEERTPKG
jgi:hypothetical protein